MLKEISFQEVIRYKLKRRDAINELQYHAGGIAVHYGKISPGCRQCFTGEQGGGIQIGTNCMSACTVCYGPRPRPEESIESINKKIEIEKIRSSNLDNNPISISYQSLGETLYYIDYLEEFSKIHREFESKKNIQIYHHLYTNGLLLNDEMLSRLKEMGIHEIRFHVTASFLNKSVIKNLYKAARSGFTVTIEEPSYPIFKEEIFSLLPILEDCGGKHLDIIETRLTEYNFKRIGKEYPNGKYYKDYFYHLFDEGLVYDIIEEVIKKNYSFSVIDCNSDVEKSRNGRFQHIGFNMNSIIGMCKDFPYFKPKPSNKYLFYENNIQHLKHT